MRTGHSPLRYLPNQNSVNTRIWKRLSIMQGYNLEIQHIPVRGILQIIFLDSLRPMKFEQKDKVRAEHRQFIERLRIPKTTLDEKIQSVLSEVIQRGQRQNSDQLSFSKFKPNIQVKEEQINE